MDRRQFVGTFGGVVQMADTVVSKATICGFESHPCYFICQIGGNGIHTEFKLQRESIRVQLPYLAMFKLNT
jgi:hypothetical protein